MVGGTLVLHAHTDWGKKRRKRTSVCQTAMRQKVENVLVLLYLRGRGAPSQPYCRTVRGLKTKLLNLVISHSLNPCFRSPCFDLYPDLTPSQMPRSHSPGSHQTDLVPAFEAELRSPTAHFLGPKEQGTGVSLHAGYSPVRIANTCSTTCWQGLDGLAESFVKGFKE